jgi:secreted trypsin-like serine protease
MGVTKNNFRLRYLAVLCALWVASFSVTGAYAQMITQISQISPPEFAARLRSPLIRNDIGDSLGIIVSQQPYQPSRLAQDALNRALGTPSPLRINRTQNSSILPISEAPWQVAVLRNPVREVFCGGTAIARNIILTAAHCVGNNTIPEHVAVLAGSSNVAEGGTIHFVTEIIIHPRYNNAIKANDIALLILDNSYVDNFIRLDLLGQSDLATGQSYRIVGWGYSDLSQTISDVLLTTSVNILNITSCSAPYGSFITNSSHICAAGPRLPNTNPYHFTSDGACRGDSGGPLFRATNGEVLQVGIIAGGGPCGDYRYPGIYTRITTHRDWLISKLPSGG